MDSKAMKRNVNPFQAFQAPGTPVPNNPDNGKGLMRAIDAVDGPNGATLLRKTYYGDAMAAVPDAPAFQTIPSQSTIGMEAPTMKGLGDTSGNLPFLFAGGNPMDQQRNGRSQQLGMSTSPSMAGSGPQRNVPRPKQA